MKYHCEICQREFETREKLVLVEEEWRQKSFCHDCLYNIAKNGNRKALNAAILKLVISDQT